MASKDQYKPYIKEFNFKEESCQRTSDLTDYIYKNCDSNVNSSGVSHFIPKFKERKIFDINDIKNFNLKITNPIEQSYDTIQEGVYNSEYYFLEKTFTVSQFIDICSEIDRQPPKNKSVKQLERIYWHEKSPIKPIYGSDQNVTEVDLGEFDLNKVKSILSDTIIEQYEGIVSAYLYFGTWRSTSPWHTEDMDLSAANLLLFGQPKLWYCIPPDFGNQFE